MHELPGPDEEGIIPLPDGRTLGYAVFGRGDGPVALWMHGTPGARRQVPPGARRFAATRGVRVICVERPGIGDSTSHQYRCVREFADDIGVLLTALAIPRCVVVGLSGGGPYTLACARALPQVVACGVLGGVAPARGPEAVDGGLSSLAGLAPALALTRRPLGAGLSLLIRAAHPFASEAFDLFMKHSRAGDREVFGAPGMKEMFLDDMLRGSRAGVRSLVHDLVLFARPWGFRLADIPVPAHFWHGDADPFVPLRHGRHMAQLVPTSSMTVQPGQSHLGGLAIAAQVLERLLPPP